MARRQLGAFLGFAVLLFIARFVARSHLIPEMDEECHIGGIAVDVLAHGVRFPLFVYAPLEYHNGSFFGGLAAALSFSLLGRRVLALKLITHVLSALAAVAMLSLLRGCLAELGVVSRWARRAATATLVIAIALAPRLATIESMGTVGPGGPGEGSAIHTILLALFASRLHARRAVSMAAFWAVVGFTLYLNKATIVLVPVLGAAEVALTWPSWRRLAAAAGGFALGQLPELPVFGGPQQAIGWSMVVAILRLHARAFPHALFDSVATFADGRWELLVAWVAALLVGLALLIRRTYPTLFVVVGTAWAYLAVLAIMATGGVDHYVTYGYPAIVVLLSMLVGVICAEVAARWGHGAGVWVGAVAVAAMLVAHRPDAMAWDFDLVRELWGDRDGAACSWHFAEGFAREHQYGLASPGRTGEQHVIDRCRSLSEPDQVLDCIGGAARELHVRRGGRVAGEPPPELTPLERRAYAFYYGVHRQDTTPCDDFASPELRADCVAAVQLEALLFADINTRYLTGRRIGRPRCAIREPPMNGYWAAFRKHLLASRTGIQPYVAVWLGDAPPSRPLFEACY